MSTGRALVVGGTGFLGRQVCARLLAAGWEVTVLTRRQPAAAPAGTRVVRLAADRPAGGQLTSVLTGFDPAVVVNAAGEVWRPDPPRLRAANVELPAQLGYAIAGSGGRARLVHLGSSLEYAPAPEPYPIDEQTRTWPETGYGWSKLAGSGMVRAIAGRCGFDAVVLRVFNALGPGISGTSLTGRTVRELLRARRERRPAELALPVQPQYRDFVDVRDVADAVLAAAVAADLGPPPHLFNLGSGVARTADPVVYGLAGASGVDYRVRRRPAAGSARLAGAGWQLADPARAGKLLGWSAQRSLPETLHWIWWSARVAADAEAGTTAGEGWQQ